ncbi:sugar kinase [Pirellulales bacterium]|nr:sugar kinase [Pirellulales bacterium]
MILCFGEIMLRLAPEGNLRIRQVLPGRLDATFAGSEANVAASLALLGQQVRYVTALPDNALGENVMIQLRGLGVDVDSCVRTEGGRLGIFFIETGANQRSSVVIYDREHSSISLTSPQAYAFEKAMEGVSWVHLSGITPALSEQAFQSTLALARMARELGAKVSCDLNFRNKLWRWKPGASAGELARECMTAILPHVTLLVANEEDAKDVLGIEAEGVSVEEGKINAQAYEEVARKIIDRFSNIRNVAITLRESLSAHHNNWGAMLFDADADRAFLAPLDSDGQYTPYQIGNIVDRVGAGDSFAAGLIHALNGTKHADPEKALRFAVASSCLCHSIKGDFNLISEQEVEALVKGFASGRVRR